MKITLFISVLIKVIIGYLVFTVVLFVFDFYSAQNVLTLIGAVYLSLAWTKYLVKDNFLRLLKKHIVEDQNRLPSNYIFSSISYGLAAIFCLTIAFF